MQEWFCSQPAQFFATSDFIPFCKVLGTLVRQGICSLPAHLWATSDFVSRSKALGTLPGG